MQLNETVTSGPNSTKAVLAKGQRTCPKCESNWDGGSILETFIQQREQGLEIWQGKSDDEIKKSIEGWTEEEIITFIDGIESFDLVGLERNGYKTGDPKEFLLSLETRYRNFYLSISHDVHVDGMYSPPYRWGREIGIEIEGGYDGISMIECPDCKTRFDRWTGKQV